MIPRLWFSILIAGAVLFVLPVNGRAMASDEGVPLLEQEGWTRHQ